MTDVTSLDALEALLAKATPGEWEFQTCPFDNYSYTLSAPAAKGNYSHVIADICLRDPAKANAALIVALHNAAPDLIAKARRVEELEAALRDALHVLTLVCERDGLLDDEMVLEAIARAALKENTDADL